MNKIYIYINFFCFIFFCSTFSIAKGWLNRDFTFWESIENQDGRLLNGEEQVVEGIVIDLKKHIRSRSNFYTFKILDPETYRTIKVELYSIKWLKRLNHFNCIDGSKIKIKAKFKYNLDGDSVGELKIKTKLKILKCKNIQLEIDE